MALRTDSGGLKQTDVFHCDEFYMKRAVLFLFEIFIILHDSNKASAVIVVNKKRLVVFSFAFIVFRNGLLFQF